MTIDECIYFPIWNEGEYKYPQSFGFSPGVHAYIHEDTKLRRGMVIVPGGAYKLVSPTESWCVGRKFYEAGYNVFIVSYTTNFFKNCPLHDLPLKELARAVRLIRRDHKEYRTDPGRITVLGFSAGAHLVASLLVHHLDASDGNTELDAISARPDAGVLCYPVITAGKAAHQESFQALLGMDIYENDEKGLLEYNSLEKHVSKDTPPVFLWHTITDELVPVENSLAFEKALREKGVRHALHLFSDGPHGLSSSDLEWAERSFEDTWCIGQLKYLCEAAERGELKISEAEKLDAKECWEDHVKKERNGRMPYREVAEWIGYAISFLNEIYD